MKIYKFSSVSESLKNALPIIRSKIVYELRFLMIKDWDNEEKSIKKYFEKLTRKTTE